MNTILAAQTQNRDEGMHTVLDLPIERYNYPFDKFAMGVNRKTFFICLHENCPCAKVGSIYAIVKQYAKITSGGDKSEHLLLVSSILTRCDWINFMELNKLFEDHTFYKDNFKFTVS